MPAAAEHPDLLLAEDMGRFYDDPLGFVMYAFDWANDPSLQVVELPAPWCMFYDSAHGPDAWACDFLDSIGAQVRANAFDGSKAVPAIREATSSGHGIGKSAITAWLVMWIMSTRPYCKGVVTANTAEQLASKTWAEIAKWKKRCITGHWFDVVTGKGNMRMTHKQFPESWRVDAQTCREENSESFAGLHAANSTPFYIFDEASAVPDTIWEVAEGGMTDGEPMWFVFGNPTRNTGRFFNCFNAARHRWSHRQIDSRTVHITNKSTIQEWVDDFGEDSDFVRVRVRGVFPRASTSQFIPRDLVDDAMSRPAPRERGRIAIVGIDVARFGDDQTVIRTRIGRDGTIEAIKMRGASTKEIAAKAAHHINWLIDAGFRVVTFVDGSGGYGAGVVDTMQDLGYEVHEIQFGAGATDRKAYANKRAEMWGRMKEWLAIGSLTRDNELATDLTGVEYGFTLTDQVQLERKERMKDRGLASPDDADALALTFAEPVAEPQPDDLPRRMLNGRGKKYDPYANLPR